MSEFVGRDRELDRMEQWWASAAREPLNLYGRRRVGKSWLFQRFAHGKPAVVLVADQLATGHQLRRFATQLAPLFGGATPAIDDVAGLFHLLYRAAAQERLLVVIDEFPYLLGSSEPDRTAVLSTIQAVMEGERDASQLRLILCGSLVAQMEALQDEKNPLHGRLQPLELGPMNLAEARLLLDRDDPFDAFARYAIAGGMPRYLAALSHGQLGEALTRELLTPQAPLWNEGRTIVTQELRTPAMYMSILTALASGDKVVGEVANVAGSKTTTINKYLGQLEQLRLVRPSLPFGSAPGSHGQLWSLADPFLRFWFRFVFPFQAALEAGLPPSEHLRTEVLPALAEHVAPVFEDVCRRHVLTAGHGVTQVGRWWGNALNEYRASGTRSSEEIDVVASARGRVTLVGECKWAAKPASLGILDDLRRYKLPALAQSGVKVAKEPHFVLFAKSAYTTGLTKRAATAPELHLVDVREMLSTQP